MTGPGEPRAKFLSKDVTQGIQYYEQKVRKAAQEEEEKRQK